MITCPSLVRFASPSGEGRYSLGHPLLDRYLEFVAGRARPNTLRAVAFDLKIFFTGVEILHPLPQSLQRVQNDSAKWRKASRGVQNDSAKWRKGSRDSE